MKRKTKFTPGPWIAVGSFVEHEDDRIADICACNPAVFESSISRSDSEMCANARLIAAAPALYSALQDLIALSWDMCPDDEQMYEFEERVGRATNLIKRINGE
jgi:hypothetical protein